MKTRITELLNIKCPIIQGGMQWLSRAELAAAVSNAGGLGIITAATQPTKQELVQEIRKTKELTDKPFGVNISMLPEIGPMDKTIQYFEAVIEENVPVVETSGRSPEQFVPHLRQAGIKLIHKVPAVRFAKKAEKVQAVPTEHRMSMLRLVENMTLGCAAVGYRTESMHGAGSPQAQRIMISRQANLDYKKKLARVSAGIEDDN